MHPQQVDIALEAIDRWRLRARIADQKCWRCRVPLTADAADHDAFSTARPDTPRIELRLFRRVTCLRCRKAGEHRPRDRRQSRLPTVLHNRLRPTLPDLPRGTHRGLPIRMSVSPSAWAECRTVIRS